MAAASGSRLRHSPLIASRERGEWRQHANKTTSKHKILQVTATNLSRNALQKHD